MLRFGDGTPFPYGQDFLEVLVDAVEACTAMFEAVDELDRERARARGARRDRDAEDKRLAGLEAAIAEAIAKAVPVLAERAERGATHAQRTAKRALAGARRTIEDSRAELKRLYAVAAAGPRWEPTAMRIHDAAAAFFERRCLPGTRWTWSWDAQATCVEATSRSGMFGATYGVDLDPVWRAPVRVGVLLDGGMARLPVRRVVGAPVVRDLSLDRLWLASARRDGEGVRLVIRAHAHASPGWLLRIPTGNAVPSVVALDKQGREVGLDYELGREDVMTKLIAAIESAMVAMLRNRRAREVRLGDMPIAAIAEVTSAPKTLLDTLAPTIRAIRARSKVSGELSLKRDVAAGVREELFVPRTAITARYANLSEPFRALLDAAGLGRALTNTTLPLTLVTAAA